MPENSHIPADIQDTIQHVRETATRLFAEGETQKASELIEEAAKLEDAASRSSLWRTATQC